MNKVKEQEVSIEKLKFWYEHGLNVMLIGKHGVGKTQKMLKALEGLDLVLGKDFLYFSAATLDPWVDFVGVPKETSVDGETFLDLVRPRIWNDNIKVIILDEFNRAPKKVRNAVMELVQFKSINGMKINSLKCIWVAENPSDDEENSYDVEQTDPAQRDRFQVQINVPYKLDKGFFTKTFGKEIFSSINEWWAGLSSEDKNQVSPRRIEYIIDYYKINGDLRDLGLPTSVNMTRLKAALDSSSPVSSRMLEYYRKKDVDGARLFINNENNYNAVIDRITTNTSHSKFYIPLMSEEKISSLIAKNVFLRNIIVNLSISDQRVTSILTNVRRASPSSKVAQDIKRKVSKFGCAKIKDALVCVKKDINKNAPIYYASKSSIRKGLQAAISEAKRCIDGGLYENPYTRQQAFKSIRQCTQQKMTEEESLGCLEVFEYLMKRTHNSTISFKWLEAMSTINNIFANLYTLNYDFKQDIDKIEHVIDFVAYKGVEKFYFEV